MFWMNSQPTVVSLSMCLVLDFVIKDNLTSCFVAPVCPLIFISNGPRKSKTLWTGLFQQRDLTVHSSYKFQGCIFLHGLENK